MRRAAEFIFAAIALGGAGGGAWGGAGAASPACCATIEIYRDVDGAWRWIRLSDEPTCFSHGPFATFRAAKADADQEKFLCDRVVAIDEPTP